ncbi:MAG: nucleotide sugar dehydrogenase, partial [Methylacidiphilales bacterium]|nr:nucleotide sugar dehydrogenase [Candidatus Methylacidiphilales bacterium]
MTCRKVVKPLVEKLTPFKIPDDIYLAHCPERILPGDIFREIIHNDRLIGGIDSQSAELASEVYKSFVKGELIITDDLSAELSKLMENTYRDVNIALANEFAQICESLGADPYKVISFANRHPRVNILQPGIGVGGHCIPVDPWFLKEIAPYNSRLITTARLINDEMPQRIAAKIRLKVANITNPKIIALGATYKKNCEDIRESPAIEIVHLLKKDGYDVHHYDPLVPHLVYDSLENILIGADLLVILVPHDSIIGEIEKIKPRLPSLMRNVNVMCF